MKLQIVYSVDDVPEEIIGIAPWRDKILIATSGRLLLMEHDDTRTLKIQEIAKRSARDWLE